MQLVSFAEREQSFYIHPTRRHGRFPQSIRIAGISASVIQISLNLSRHLAAGISLPPSFYRRYTTLLCHQVKAYVRTTTYRLQT